jgi:chromosome segregation ATPase
MIDPRKFDQVLAHFTDLKDYIAEYAVVVGGELDAKYKQVREQIAEWDKRTDYAKATEQLKRDQTDFYAAQDVFAKTKTAGEKKLADWEANLKKREAELESGVKQLADDKRALIGERSSHETMASGMKAALAQREKELAAKEAGVQQFQGQLHERSVKLSEREKKVESALAMLNSAIR